MTEADQSLDFVGGALDQIIPAAGLCVPLELIGPYPMIRGSVNGRPGRFMLDTGTRMGALLNNNLLSLEPGVEIGQGFAGSGQSVVLQRHASVAQLELWPGAMLEQVDWAYSADFQFIERGIAADFLGFIGMGVLAPYEFTLDYAGNTVFFSRLAEDGTALATSKGETDRVTTLRFEIPRPRNAYDSLLPVVPFDLGAFTFPLSLDTGSSGGKLLIREAVKTALETSNVLRPDGQRFSVTLAYDGGSIDLDGLSVEIGETEHGTLGYALLSRFKTTWNYSTRTLKLVSVR